MVVTAWMFGTIDLPHRDEGMKGGPILKSYIHASCTKMPPIAAGRHQRRTRAKSDLSFLKIAQIIGTILAEPRGAMKCAMLRAVPIFDVAVQLP